MNETGSSIGEENPEQKQRRATLGMAAFLLLNPNLPEDTVITVDLSEKPDQTESE